MYVCVCAPFAHLSIENVCLEMLSMLVLAIARPVWFAACFKSNIHLYMISLHFPKKSVIAKIPIINQCYQESLRGNNTTLKSCLAVCCPKDIGLKHLTCLRSEAAIKFGMIFPSSVHQLRQTSWFYEYSYSISVETENNTLDSLLKF